MRQIRGGLNRVIRPALTGDLQHKLPIAPPNRQHLRQRQRIDGDREIICVALNGGVPLSETSSVKLFVEFACVTSGRNENAPLLVLTVALVAPANIAKVSVSVCGCWSESVAMAVKATVWPTFTVWLAMGTRVGGVFQATESM